MSATTVRQRVAAYGVAQREGSILLTRASPRSGVPGTWWLPGGGVELGEDPRDCLAREFIEETGLPARAGRVLDVVSDVDDMVQEPVRLHSIRLIYEVEISSGATRPEVDGSTDAVMWVAPELLRDLPLIPWLRDFATTHLVGDQPPAHRH